MSKIKLDKKNEIINLIHGGKSLNEISRKTGLSKTTIYYHYRKFHGKITTSPKIQKENIESLGEFIGVIAGDGYTNLTKNYKYLVRIFLNIKEEEYSDSLSDMLENFLGKRPHKYVHKKGNCIHLRFISKDIFYLIEEYLSWKSAGHRSKSRSICLRKIESDKKFKIGFLRGCVDTDGYINKNRIMFSTASKKLCKNIENFLQTLGIKFSTRTYLDKRPNRSLMYYVNIKPDNREKFLSLIKPRNMRPPGFEPGYLPELKS